jgi:hypothetical protein
MLDRNDRHAGVARRCDPARSSVFVHEHERGGSEPFHEPACADSLAEGDAEAAHAARERRCRERAEIDPVHDQFRPVQPDLFGERPRTRRCRSGFVGIDEDVDNIDGKDKFAPCRRELGPGGVVVQTDVVLEDDRVERAAAQSVEHGPEEGVRRVCTRAGFDWLTGRGLDKDQDPPAPSADEGETFGDPTLPEPPDALVSIRSPAIEPSTKARQHLTDRRTCRSGRWRRRQPGDSEFPRRGGKGRQIEERAVLDTVHVDGGGTRVSSEQPVEDPDPEQSLVEPPPHPEPQREPERDTPLHEALHVPTASCPVVEERRCLHEEIAFCRHLRAEVARGDRAIAGVGDEPRVEDHDDVFVSGTCRCVGGRNEAQCGFARGSRQDEDRAAV